MINREITAGRWAAVHPGTRIKPAASWQERVSSGHGRCSQRGGSMAGKFVLKKGSSGKYHFNLLAANGQVIATSETYERKQSALSGIESVKKNAPDAEIDDQTEE